MESVKKLEAACNEVLDGINELNGRETRLNVSIKASEIGLKNLYCEITALTIKKKELEDKVHSIEQDKQKEWNKKENSLQAKSDELAALQAKNLAREQELSTRLSEAQKSKESYDNLRTQLDEKMNLIKKQQELLKTSF